MTEPVYLIPHPDALAHVEATFRKWLHLPDPGALHAMLAAVAANRIEGDPVWLLLVGPPGGGKSELLGSLTNLEDVHPAATLTEAALLSGTPKREHDQSAKGGLLRVIGDFGIIVAKDFTSVLSMNRDARALVLAALREIYDGSWVRHVGTDGGRTLAWHGKVGFVGGVTPTIDRHHAVMGTMGERFILYRIPEVDPQTQAHRALNHAGREKEMRTELADAVHAFLAGLTPQSAAFDLKDAELLVDLATLIVRARSAVERDSYSRDIELIPEPEAPTRLVVVLRRLLQGLDAIGLHRDHAWEVITKTALDSVPALRRDVLFLLQRDGPAETPQVAERLDYPTSTARRALEDLNAHGLVLRTIRGEGRRADTWAISPFADDRIRRCVPEKSSNTVKGKRIGAKTYTPADITGTQTPLPSVPETSETTVQTLIEQDPGPEQNGNDPGPEEPQKDDHDA